MAETSYNLERDLKEAKALAESLIPYIYEDQVYGKVSGGGMFAASNMPALTVGALLMRLRRLRALADRLTPAQRETLAQVEAQHESVRHEWMQHYQGKLAQEAKSRLMALNQFFIECAEDPRACAGGYLPEALRRTIVQEIVAEMKTQGLPTTDLAAAIRKADANLRRYSEPSDFIWAKELEPVYPQGQYGWLYARPAQP